MSCSLDYQIVIDMCWACLLTCSGHGQYFTDGFECTLLALGYTPSVSCTCPLVQGQPTFKKEQHLSSDCVPYCHRILNRIGRVGLKRRKSYNKVRLVSCHKEPSLFLSAWVTKFLQHLHRQATARHCQRLSIWNHLLAQWPSQFPLTSNPSLKGTRAREIRNCLEI